MVVNSFAEFDKKVLLLKNIINEKEDGINKIKYVGSNKHYVSTVTTKKKIVYLHLLLNLECQYLI